MAATVIDGNALANELHARLAGEVRELASAGVRPGLATLLVGDDYPAQAYERRVRHLADELDCLYVCEQLPGDSRNGETPGETPRSRPADSCGRGGCGCRK